MNISCLVFCKENMYNGNRGDFGLKKEDSIHIHIVPMLLFEKVSFESLNPKVRE